MKKLNRWKHRSLKLQRPRPQSQKLRMHSRKVFLLILKRQTQKRPNQKHQVLLLKALRLTLLRWLQTVLLLTLLRPQQNQKQQQLCLPLSRIQLRRSLFKIPLFKIHFHQVKRRQPHRYLWSLCRPLVNRPNKLQTPIIRQRLLFKHQSISPQLVRSKRLYLRLILSQWVMSSVLLVQKIQPPLQLR